eukprot:TRINITY_DN2195_c0_g1_i1.p1 TRINITY_DN2195_c0_g1~~TRINITY_DN2195_c0_g1_i1.p1  ORF type:complete len:317 (-),score=59.77 TRINITY_DN2195_c0_g1_i1:263-1213(-)
MTMAVSRALAILAVALCLFTPVDGKVAIRRTGEHENAQLVARVGDTESVGRVSTTTVKPVEPLAKSAHDKNLIAKLKQKYGVKEKDLLELPPNCKWLKEKAIQKRLWWPQAKLLSGFKDWKLFLQKARGRKNQAADLFWAGKKTKFWAEAVKKYQGIVKHLNEPARKFFWEKQKAKWKTFEGDKKNVTAKFAAEWVVKRALNWDSFSTFWSRAETSFWKKVNAKKESMTKERWAKYHGRMKERWTGVKARLPKIKAWWDETKKLKDKFQNRKQAWWKNLRPTLKQIQIKGVTHFKYCKGTPKEIEDDSSEDLELQW